MPGRRRWISAVGATVVVGALAAVLLAVPSVRHQVVLSVARQPEKYIELSLADPTTLPEVEPAGRRVGFKFDLVAHGGEPARTAYTVALVVPGATRQIDGGTVTTPSDTPVVVDTSFEVPSSGVTYTVEVALPGDRQYVAFHGRST